MKNLQLLTLLAILFGVATNVCAVVITDGDGSGNTTAPADDPGFANVGIRGAGTAIYLGNRWVLTAQHIGPGAVTFGGVEYQPVFGEGGRLTNPVWSGNLSTSTDLHLFRIQNDPGLPPLRISCDPVGINDRVTMVGAGRDREAEQTHWSVDVSIGDNNDVWTETTEANADRTGYKTQTSRTVRWGENLVSLAEIDVDANWGDVISFQTRFHPIVPIEEMAQAVNGDSGGAVFHKQDDVWELVGLIHSINLLERQPDGTRTAIFLNETMSADLHFYVEKIREIADFEPAPGDANGDGLFDDVDIDRMLQMSSNASLNSCHFDLTGDGRVNDADVDELLAAANSVQGDATLDGRVDLSDFLAVSRSFNQFDTGWANGDFDGDGQTNLGDYLILSRNFGRRGPSSAATRASAVPEPGGGLLAMFSGILLLHFARRGR